MSYTQFWTFVDVAHGYLVQLVSLLLNASSFLPVDYLYFHLTSFAPLVDASLI